MNKNGLGGATPSIRVARPSGEVCGVELSSVRCAGYETQSAHTPVHGALPLPRHSLMTCHDTIFCRGALAPFPACSSPFGAVWPLLRFRAPPANEAQTLLLFCPGIVVVAVLSAAAAAAGCCCSAGWPVCCLLARLVLAKAHGWL